MYGLEDVNDPGGVDSFREVKSAAKFRSGTKSQAFGRRGSPASDAPCC